jgi:hypothetical protein
MCVAFGLKHCLGLVIWLPKITNCMKQYVESNIMFSGKMKHITKRNIAIHSNMEVLCKTGYAIFQISIQILQDVLLCSYESSTH